MSDEHDGNWIVYMKSLADDEGEAAAVVFVDLSRGERDSSASLPRLVRVVLLAHDTNENGLPTPDDLDALQAAESVVEEAMKSVGAEFVGAVTVGGRRDSVFYAPADAKINAALLSRVPADRLDEEPLVIEDDPEWEFYWSILYPSPEEERVIGDSEVIRNLVNAGDVPTTPRRVDHWAYFPTDTCRDRFIAWAKTQGYEIDSLIEPGELEQAQFGVQFFETTDVEPETIHPKIAAICEAAAEADGEYDGWETFVMKEGDVDSDLA